MISRIILAKDVLLGIPGEIKTLNSLREQAKAYVTRIAQDLDRGLVLLKDVPKIQRTIDTAREQGLLEDRVA